MKKNESVLVTGGSGYIATYIIAQLLVQGYSVRTTVRSLKRMEEVREALAELGQTTNKELQFFEADLIKDTGWAAAMTDVTYVLHVASPLPFSMPKDENELIIPAKEGTLRVLRAAKNAGVKRVVMTSAFGAAGMGYTAARNDYVFTEKDWSNLASDTKLNAYYKSKTIAERSAWDFVSREENLELVTILPVAVIGPALGKKVTGSNQLIATMLSGHLPGFLDIYIPVIDVRDLAKAHIAALETPDAAGERFIISNGQSLSMKQIGMILKNHLGEAAKKIPNRSIPSFILKFASLFNSMARDTIPDLGVNRKMSNANARKILQWKPDYSVEETIIATGKSIIEKNISA